MDINWSYLIAPIVGGGIGYITNEIAIRMLFRPHRAKYIFGCHVPFTPGIIPKEKGRLAKSIGDVISKNLLNNESLEKYLLSDEMITKLRIAVDEFVSDLKKNKESVFRYMEHYLSKEEISQITYGIKNNLSTQIYTTLVNSSLGSDIAKLAMNHVKEKLGAGGVAEIIDGIKDLYHGLKGLASAFVGESIVERIFSWIRIPIEEYLERNINAMIEKNGQQIAENLIDSGIDKFMNTSIEELLNGKDDQISQFANSIESIYRKVITEHLPNILRSVDISSIVQNRINEMDVAEAEGIILSVIKKELKAVVWFGAMLGLIIGCLNILI